MPPKAFSYDQRVGRRFGVEGKPKVSAGLLYDGASAPQGLEAHVTRKGDVEETVDDLLLRLLFDQPKRHQLNMPAPPARKFSTICQVTSCEALEMPKRVAPWSPVKKNKTHSEDERNSAGDKSDVVCMETYFKNLSRRAIFDYKY